MKNLKNLALSLLAILAMSTSARAQGHFYEPWKGKTITSPFEFGALSGANFYGKEVNWSVLITAAYMIEEEGWAQDLDDRIWIELESGPAFFSIPGTINNEAGFQYSAHLRWDFTYNEYWTFYGLGGLGGYALPPTYGRTFIVRPRFGAGVQYQTKAALMFRGELSSDFMGVGIGFNF